MSQALEKQKPAGASNTTGPGARAEQNNLFNPIIAPNSSKVNRPGALGQLLDQALAHMDYHRRLADEYRQLADYHAGQALAHKAILSELQKLIPGGQHHGQQ